MQWNYDIVRKLTLFKDIVNICKKYKQNKTCCYNCYFIIPFYNRLRDKNKSYFFYSLYLATFIIYLLSNVFKVRKPFVISIIYLLFIGE